jgi:hypothetical protein
MKYYFNLLIYRPQKIDFSFQCETIKSECDLLNNAGMVCKCYERALQLDPTQSTLWIERGTFSYTIHSFCSNLLKKVYNTLVSYLMLKRRSNGFLYLLPALLPSIAHHIHNLFRQSFRYIFKKGNYIRHK